jgi:hypothetical protein
MQTAIVNHAADAVVGLPDELGPMTLEWAHTACMAKSRFFKSS